MIFRAGEDDGGGGDGSGGGGGADVGSGSSRSAAVAVPEKGGVVVETATALCFTLKLPSAISMFVRDPKSLLS